MPPFLSVLNTNLLNLFSTFTWMRELFKKFLIQLFYCSPLKTLNVRWWGYFFNSFLLCLIPLLSPEQLTSFHCHLTPTTHCVQLWPPGGLAFSFSDQLFPTNTSSLPKAFSSSIAFLFLFLSQTPIFILVMQPRERAQKTRLNYWGHPLSFNIANLCCHL